MYVCGKFVNSVESLKKTVSTISTSADKADLTAAVLDGDLLTFLKECHDDNSQLISFLESADCKSQANDELFNETCRLLGISKSKVAAIHENMNGRILISAFLDNVELGEEELILRSDSTETHTLTLKINITSKTRAKRTLKVLSNTGALLFNSELNLNEDRTERSFDYVIQPDSRDSIKINIDGLHSSYKIACSPILFFRAKEFQDPETGLYGLKTEKGGFPVLEAEYKKIECIEELGCFFVRIPHGDSYVYDINGKKRTFKVSIRFQNGISYDEYTDVVTLPEKINTFIYKGVNAVKVYTKGNYYNLCRDINGELTLVRS